MFKRGFLNRTDAFDASAPVTATDSSAKKQVTAEKGNTSFKRDSLDRQDAYNTNMPVSASGSAEENVTAEQENKTFKHGFLDRQDALDANKSVAASDSAAEKARVEEDNILSAWFASHFELFYEEDEKEGAESIKPELKSAPVTVTRKPPSKDIPFTIYTESIPVLDSNQMTSELLSRGYTQFPTMSIRLCSINAPTPFYKDTIFCAWLGYDGLLKIVPHNWGSKDVPTPLPRPYRIAASPGAGLGMFATRDIDVAETILIERPVILMPQCLPDEIKSLDVHLRTALDRLPQEASERFNALTCCKAMEKWGSIFGKVMTNSLKCNFPQAAELFQTYAGVYLDTARCNHSCGPNAVWAFDSRTLLMELRASRTIAAGEEITLEYTGIHQSRGDRQKALSSGYSFTCKCRYCTLPPSQTKASDKRRERVSLTLNQALGRWEQMMKGPKKQWSMLINAYENAVRFAEQEGLEKDHAHLHRFLAAAYAAIGDEVNFRKWAEKAKVTERLVEKDGFGFVLNGEEWDEWLRDPTSIPCWNQRK